MQPETIPVINAALLQRARQLASQSQRSVVDELEGLTGADPRLLAQAIAAPFQLTLMETSDMLAMTPAFDLLSLSKAMQKNCVLLRTVEQIGRAHV
jgi:general secretion pathway protein E